MSTATNDKIQELAAAAIGKKCWGTKAGAFLTIELGEPDRKEPNHGQWHLWIYSAAWRVDVGARCVAGQTDNDESSLRAAERIDGSTLEAIDVGRFGDTTFRLSNGARVTAFVCSAYAGDPYWMLYRPNATVVSVGPGLRVQVEHAHGSAREPHR